MWLLESPDLVIELVETVMGRGGGDASRAALGALGFDRQMRALEEGDEKIDRARWREAHGVEWSFPAGTVATSPNPESLVPASVAVTASELIVISEGVRHPGDPDELGRIPRADIDSIEIVQDGSGTPRGRDKDALDPEVLTSVVLRWHTEAGASHEAPFVFRSASVAQDALLRFRRALPSRS